MLGEDVPARIVKNGRVGRFYPILNRNISTPIVVVSFGLRFSSREARLTDAWVGKLATAVPYRKTQFVDCDASTWEWVDPITLPSDVGVDHTATPIELELDDETGDD